MKKRYLTKNKTSGDCQLVTAVNAHTCLTGKLYCDQDSDEYERLVDLSGCRHGSAIRIDKVHRKLGLTVVWQGNNLLDLRRAFDNYAKPALPLPIEWNNWSWEYGMHSTLIVDYVAKCETVRVLNFDRVTGYGGWMFVDDMHKYEDYSMQRKHESFRFFRLVGDPDNRRLKRAWRKERDAWFEQHRKFYANKLRQKKPRLSGFDCNDCDRLNECDEPDPETCCYGTWEPSCVECDHKVQCRKFREKIS